MLKLIGSQTSPYVRKLRIFMLENKIPFEFQAIDLNDPQEGKELEKVSPIKKIPVMLVDGQPLYESRIIYQYLERTLGRADFVFEDENLLSSIDACTDSCVNLLLLKRSGFDINSDVMFFNRQRHRIGLILKELTPHAVTLKERNLWNFTAMALYSLLDWASLREMIRLSDWPELQKFKDHFSERQSVKETRIVL